MNRRFIAALAVAAVLIFAVFLGQVKLYRTASDLADRADAICALLGDERLEEGQRELTTLFQSFSGKKTFFLFFVNDARFHEILRSLERACRLVEENDPSPALEALSDFSSALREVSRTHVPTLGNIF